MITAVIATPLRCVRPLLCAVKAPMAMRSSPSSSNRFAPESSTGQRLPGGSHTASAVREKPNPSSVWPASWLSSPPEGAGMCLGGPHDVVGPERSDG